MTFYSGMVPPRYCAGSERRTCFPSGVDNVKYRAFSPTTGGGRQYSRIRKQRNQYAIQRNYLSFGKNVRPTKPY